MRVHLQVLRFPLEGDLGLLLLMWVCIRLARPHGLKRHLLVFVLPLEGDFELLKELLMLRWPRKRMIRPYGVWRHLLLDEFLDEGGMLLIITGVAMLAVELCTYACCFNVVLLQLSALEKATRRLVACFASFARLK